MNFKMTHDDFQLLNKFIEKKAKGSALKIEIEAGFEHRLKVQVEMETGETAVITFFDDQVNKFALITRTRNLGDEL